MIDIDKCKAAWVSQPLCQKEYCKRSTGGRPTRLCAISALLSYPGVSVDLVDRVYADWSITASESFERLVLQAEYGIPPRLSAMIPMIFDAAKNESAGIDKLVKRFEDHNAREARKLAKRAQHDEPQSGASWIVWSFTP